MKYNVGDFVRFTYGVNKTKAERTVYLTKFVEKRGNIYLFNGVLLNDSAGFYDKEVDVWYLAPDTVIVKRNGDKL